MKIRTLASGIALGALACGPLWMLPGGSLSGEVRPVPTNWTAFDDEKVVQLEVRPSDPYSVNIWGVGMGPDFYVASGGGSGSEWATAMGDDPNVRLRIAGSVYELRSVRVEDEQVLSRFLAELERKYDFEPDEEQSGEAWLFRLSER